MTRVPPRHFTDSTPDGAPVHAREARADNRIWQRGALLVQKLWRLNRHLQEHNAPLPFLRGKR